MKGSDWFIVGVRLIGVWYLAQAAYFVVTFLDAYLKITPLPITVTTPFTYVFYAFGNLCITMMLLIGARPLALACFGQAANERSRFMDDDETRFTRSIDRGDSSTH